jgi:chitosanase
MITTPQKSKIEAVINVFETGKKEGKYDALVVYRDGRGGSRQITYGRSQTTEQGNLKTLIVRYIENGGLYAEAFRPYLNQVGSVSLADNAAFKNLLRLSARKDAVMRTTQDTFFDVLYYQPAYHFFKVNGFTEALSLLVIYDSYIHSGGVPRKLRERFAEHVPLNGGNERKWVEQYVETRHNWLLNHPNKLLRRTVYRTICFKEQIAHKNWNLEKGILCNGVVV